MSPTVRMCCQRKANQSYLLFVRRNRLFLVENLFLWQTLPHLWPPFTNIYTFLHFPEAHCLVHILGSCARRPMGVKTLSRQKLSVVTPSMRRWWKNPETFCWKTFTRRRRCRASVGVLRKSPGRLWQVPAGSTDALSRYACTESAGGSLWPTSCPLRSRNSRLKNQDWEEKMWEEDDAADAAADK